MAGPMSLGDQFWPLRKAVERMAGDADAQVEYLVHQHIDGDELWNGLDDYLLTSLVNLEPHGVLSRQTLDALGRLEVSAHLLFDHGLGSDEDIRSHPLWATTRARAADALASLDEDSHHGQADWLRLPYFVAH